MRDPQMIGKDAPQSMDEVLATQPRREHVTISLSIKTIGIVFGILLTIWVLKELSGTLLIFAGAILLATAIDRPVSWMQSRGIPRGFGITIIFAGVVGLLVGVVAVLIPLVTDETVHFKDHLSDYQRQFEDELNKFGIKSSENTHQISLDQITSRIGDNVSTIASSLTSITIGIGHTAVLIFAMLVISFMLAMDPTSGTRFARRFLTDSAHARMQRISGDIHDRIGGWVRGQVLVAATFGIAFGLGLWIIGVPYAASLGLAAGVLEVMPYLGGAITVVIAAIVALTIGVPQLVAVLVLYAILINIESHILAPRFIG
ncbi:MAG TPA: AI-2E family transporter, partial [Thermomicrobiales bacterium]|nr:AI-2E family transporter [Thermomicrobiales bacterium]